MTDRHRHYEAEKRKLQEQNLTPTEYEKAVRELVKRLKI